MREVWRGFMLGAGTEQAGVHGWQLYILQQNKGELWSSFLPLLLSLQCIAKAFHEGLTNGSLE